MLYCAQKEYTDECLKCLICKNDVLLNLYVHALEWKQLIKRLKLLCHDFRGKSIWDDN
jgi:hypothetical protein